MTVCIEVGLKRPVQGAGNMPGTHIDGFHLTGKARNVAGIDQSQIIICNLRPDLISRNNRQLPGRTG